MELIRNKQTASLIILLCFLSIIAVGVISVRKNKAIAVMCQSMREDLRKSTLGDVLSDISGQSVYVKNMTTGDEYVSKNSKTIRPLASLTKLMTVRTVLRQNNNTEAKYTLTETDTAPYGTMMGIESGSEFRIKDLMLASLVASSNDSAEALMYSTGIQTASSFYEAMKKESRDNDWQSFDFSGVTGLDFEEKPTALGNAEDVASLLYKNITEYPDTFIFPQTELSIRSTTGNIVTLQPTNEAIPSLPLLVAGKTGYTVSAGGNLAILWRHPLAQETYISAVVLGSTFSGRFYDIVKLYTSVNSFLEYEHSLSEICK